MRKLTGPILIVSPPRSRADLMARMLRADGIPCADADGLLTKISTLGDGSPVWQEAILGNLRAAANAETGAETFAVIDRMSGHLGWEPARRQWSWILDVVPNLTIVFLLRDYEKTAISLEQSWRVWVPKYGNCASSCEKNLASHCDSIRRFSELRPDRTILVDSDDILSFTKRPKWISDEAWTQEVVVKTNEIGSLVPPPADPDWDDWVNVPQAKMEGEEIRVSDTNGEPPKQYILEVDPSIPVVSSLEVHTLRYGLEPWVASCAPAMDAWCERHGYKLVVHGEPQGLPDEKFSTIDMIRQFLAGDAEKMLFVDGDVFPHPQAPAFPDLPGFAAYVETFGRVLRNWRRWDDSVRGWSYRNSGVWSCDREAAIRFLEEVPEDQSEWLLGYREQHQFNAWWSKAVTKGMVMSDLPVEWNRLSKVQKTEMAPAWFFHLNGPEKMRTLRTLRAERMLPPPARPFEAPERTGIERAICYPWVKGLAAWEELRFSLRSVLENFEDKECPIFILGPDRPKWLADHPRLKHVFIDYSEGRAKGLFEAFRIGTTIAEQVLWMNDDEVLLKPVGWDDFDVAVTEGRLDHKVDELRGHENKWRQGMANAVIDLRHNGFEGAVMRFATHTPFLFERDKAIEIFQRFHLPFKGGWVNLYHNWHRTPHKPIGKLKTHSLDRRRVYPETTFLNYRDSTLTGALKRQIEEAFPEKAEWETDLPESSALPYFGKGAVVWPWIEEEAEYDELWFSVQSVNKHFSEKDWVHVLLGETKPSWWKGEFVKAPRYEEALYVGAQCADRVLWMNDDIFMIADQSPSDFAMARVATNRKTAKTLSTSENTWEQRLGNVMIALEAKGLKSKNYETHTPYLFFREKVQAAFDVFPPRQRREPFATVYHNIHATPSKTLTEKAKTLADTDGKLWINPQSREITSELIEELENRFGKPPQKI